MKFALGQAVPRTEDPRLLTGRGRYTVEYEPLLSVTATEKALSPGAPKLWAECHDNECFFFTLGDQRAVEAAFAQAQSAGARPSGAPPGPAATPARHRRRQSRSGDRV